MAFSSPIFLLFLLPTVMLLAFATRRVGLQNALLLAASLLFYAWGEPSHTLILIASIAVNYSFGLWIDSARDQPRQRSILIAAIGANLSLLAYFKYANFATTNLNSLFELIGFAAIHVDPVKLPIGISFFTFQALTYVVDVYRRDAEVQRSVLRLGLYIAMFPQLIAGPIVRYRTIAVHLLKRRSSTRDVAAGIRRFVIGLAKKLLVADQLAVTVDRIFALPGDTLPFTVAWLGAVAFTLQIYFDFAAYSDMAIGLGRTFGFRFPENFDVPYSSRSIREFWRRWHISLSLWFRDYVYIPLGGNRRGNLRTVSNLIAVFLLCGFWHGASWKFVLWGFIHGLFLTLERNRFGDWLRELPRPIAQAYTMLIVCCAFVLFRASDVPHAADYHVAMAGFGGALRPEHAITPFFDREVATLLVVGVRKSGSSTGTAWTQRPCSTPSTRQTTSWSRWANEMRLEYSTKLWRR